MMSSRLLAFQMSGGPPYGLRLQGGDGLPFIVAKIRPASKAEAVGLLEGDVLVAVNSVQCRGLSHSTTTSLMDLNDSLLTVHVLRGPGAMGDVASAERSMGSQLTVLSEADALALVGSSKPSVIVATPADTAGLYNTPGYGEIQLMAAPAGRNTDTNLASQPGASYTRNEQTFNDGGTERKVIEEKETKKYGGTTMTTVTRKEFSTYNSSGGGNYQPRQDPFVRSVQDETFGVRGQPDWFGERREDRSQYSVSTSQPRQQAQPSSALEYVESYTAGGSPYSDNEPSRFGGGFDRQPQPAPAATPSWQQMSTNNPNVRTYYEGDIQPGQNVVMPGFTISIEAPRQGGQTAGPQPIVTVTPADSDAHVMVTPSRWQDQTPSQSSWQAAPVPVASNFRVTGPSQIYRSAEDDMHQQYGTQQVRTVFQQSEQQPVSEGQWRNAPVDRSWNNPVEVRNRLEEMGRDWKNEEMSSQQQQQQMYAAPSRVENVMVTVGNTPNYTYKPVVQQEPEGPFYATKPYSVNQQPPAQRLNNPPQRSQSVQNHAAEPQYYEQGPTFPYNARGVLTRNNESAQQQQQPQPPTWSNTYQPPAQAPAARYQQQSQPQSPPAAEPKHNLYLPRSNQASSSTPDMNESNYYDGSHGHSAPMNRSSSYPAGFSPQPPPQPPAPQYTSPGFTPRTSQVPNYQAAQYQNEPQTAPVKPTFKLPLNPHFNKSIFGNESSGSPNAADNQDSAPNSFNQPSYFGQQDAPKVQLGQVGSPTAAYGGDMQYNPQANVPPQNDGFNYGGGPAPTRNMWSPPAMQNSNQGPWQGGFVPGPGDRQQYMEQTAGDGGYYNPAAMIPSPPPIGQMPPGGMILPSAPAGPPPPVAPPLPENPFKIYGLTTSSADPERRNMENKVKLANSVAHAVTSPENVNSRGQKMFLRRQQNSHKWTTSGPDPVEQQQDNRQQPWAAAPQRQGQGQPPQGMSRSPQAERRINPVMDSSDVGGGRGGALFAKIRQRSESAERAAAERQWQSGGPRPVQPGGFSQQQQQQYQGMNPMTQFRSQPTLASNQFGGVSDL